jgi:hypothetical protein
MYTSYRYAFFALPPGTKRAPSGWGGSTRDDQADPNENLVDYIKGLHEGWSPEVHAVLDATNRVRIIALDDDDDEMWFLKGVSEHSSGFLRDF